MTESPYGKKHPAYFMQFEPPRRFGGMAQLIRTLISNSNCKAESLVVCDGFGWDQPEELAIINSMRLGFREKRLAMDAPGHLFEENEGDLKIGLCSLALMFGSSAYLYEPAEKVSLLLWEGDLIDVWASDDLTKSHVREVVSNFKLKITWPKSDTAI